MWLWHIDIFALWFCVPQNYMRICFRNINSGKLKWKECTRRHDCFFFCIRLNSSCIFHFQLPLTHFYSCFFFCHLMPFAYFLKKSQNFIVTNFCITSTLFHHKYIDRSFTKGNKKPVSLPNQFIGCRSSLSF